MSGLGTRMLGAARLDAAAYEEVEADPGSLGQAALVVGLAALAGAGGGAGMAYGAGVNARALAIHVAAALLLPPLLWVGGSAFAYMTGATFFRGPDTRADFAEVLRTTGFAFTPGLLLVCEALPPAWLGLGIAWLARLWIIAAGVVAVRQALDFGTARALGTFGTATLLLWILLWGLAVIPLPF